MKTTFIILGTIVIIWIVLLVLLGKLSQRTLSKQEVPDILTPCESNKNCAFMTLSKRSLGEIPDTDYLSRVLDQSGGRIVNITDHYVAAEFKSSIFGLVDDVELTINKDNDEIQIRSVSRVGHYDFGTNRRRLEKIKEIAVVSN